jgi:hypothetical protein
MVSAECPTQETVPNIALATTRAENFGETLQMLTLRRDRQARGLRRAKPMSVTITGIRVQYEAIFFSVSIYTSTSTLPENIEMFR